MKASFIIAFAALFAAASALPANVGRPVVPMGSGHGHHDSQSVGAVANHAGGNGALNNLAEGGVLSNNKKDIDINQVIAKHD